MKLLFVIRCVKSNIAGTPSHIFVMAICRGVLPGEFAVAICRGNSPQLFAVGLFCVCKQTFFLFEQILFLCKQIFFI